MRRSEAFLAPPLAGRYQSRPVAACPTPCPTVRALSAVAPSVAGMDDLTLDETLDGLDLDSRPATDATWQQHVSRSFAEYRRLHPKTQRQITLERQAAAGEEDQSVSGWDQGA
jgi:hypothetical protein